jgi:hypothetical protein
VSLIIVDETVARAVHWLESLVGAIGTGQSE